MKYKYLAFLIPLLVASCGGGEKVSLELNLPENQKYKMTIVTESQAESSFAGQNMSQSSTEEDVYRCQVMSRTPEGYFVVRSYQVSSINKAGGKTEVLDSVMLDSIAQKNSEIVTDIGDKWQAYYEDVQISISGEVKKVSATDINGNKKQDLTMPTCGEYIITFPKKAITVGSSWTVENEKKMLPVPESPSCVETKKYKLVSIKDGIAEIKIKSTYKCELMGAGFINTSIQGVAFVDMLIGLTKKMTLEVDQTMEPSDETKSFGIKSVMKKKITITIQY